MVDANRPIAAVFRWPENRVMAAKGRKGALDQPGVDLWAVCTDHDTGRRTELSADMANPVAKIPPPLRASLDRPGGPACISPSGALIHRQDQPPLTGAGEPGQQSVDGPSIKTDGRHRADITGQACLDAPDERRLCHKDQDGSGKGHSNAPQGLWGGRPDDTLS